MKTEETSAETVPSKDVAGQFSFSVKLDQSNDKTFNITGFIYAGDDLAAANARVDMIDELISRQATRSSIPLMEADLEQRLKNLQNMFEHVNGLQQEREALKNKPKGTWTSLEKKQFIESQKVIDQSATTLDGIKKDLDRRRAAIADAKVKAL
jgi:hypothetical protein